jgi:GTP cyclohydrolase II
MHVPHRVIRPQGATTEFLAKASIPTRHGNFETHVFRRARPAHESDGSHSLPLEDVALVFGNVRGREDTLVRVHSECITSEVFGSLKCDCKEQLDAAMAAVAHAGAGAVLYLRQEGRGIGLANKIRAYALQSRGHDTVDANRLLGLPDDARRYDVARDMLEHLGIASVTLMTNNPAKVDGLRALGVRVSGRLPVIVPPTAHSAGYLEAKRLRMEHDLPAGEGVRHVPRLAEGPRQTTKAAGEGPRQLAEPLLKKHAIGDAE